MKILTMTAAPYLLTKLGRLNANVLQELKKDGYEVASACWHLDTTWFLPDENNHFFYEVDEEKIARLYPFVHVGEKSSPQIYEIVKDYEPDIVISIGDYQEVDFLYALKALEPDSFKWLSILTIDAYPINATRKDAFDYADYILTTTKKAEKEISCMTNTKISYVPVGVDTDTFYFNDAKSDNFKIFYGSKNSQSTNIAAFLSAISMLKQNMPNEDIKVQLYTNINDFGDYDIELLLDRYNIADYVQMPDEFVGLNDGISDYKLRKLLNQSDIFVDCSVRSGTAMFVSEAMVCGCIPLVSKVAALEELVAGMGMEELFIDGVDYVGELSESYYVISAKSLFRKILKMFFLKKDNPDKYNKIKKKAVNVGSNFRRENFVEKIRGIVKQLKNNKQTFSVDNI